MTALESAYLGEAERVLRALDAPRFAPFWTRPPRSGEWHGLSSMLQSFVFLYALVYRAHGRPRDLARARHFLELYLASAPDGAEHFAALFTGAAYELLAGDLTEAERRRWGSHWVGNVRGALNQFVGTHPAAIESWPAVANHPLCACVYADYAGALFPELAAAADFAAVTDRVWARWWELREFHEQASNYECFAQAYLCKWAELRGVETAFYGSPSVANMLARDARIVSPGGIVAAYGDSGHHEHSAAWIALYERVGAATGDGAWRRLALDCLATLRAAGWRRMPRVLARMLAENPYAGRGSFNLWLRAATYLGLAGLWADGALEPTTRPSAAGLNTRIPVGTPVAAADRLLPCQAALTGGRTYCLLSVGPKLPHDHADAGAILLLARGRTTLLGSNGYLQRELCYHNVFFVQDAALARFPDDTPGAAFMGDPDCAGSVEELDVASGSSRCRVRFPTFHGYPVEVEREVIVDRTGAVTVLDRATARAEGLVGGPLFHGQEVQAEGNGVYRLTIGELMSMNGFAWANGPAALRVEFCHPAAVGVSRRRLREPAVYGIPGYSRFPTVHYRKIWRRSYGLRTCLAASRPLPQDEPVLFLTRLTPVTA